MTPTQRELMTRHRVDVCAVMLPTPSDLNVLVSTAEVSAEWSMGEKLPFQGI